MRRSYWMIAGMMVAVLVLAGGGGQSKSKSAAMANNADGWFSHFFDGTVVAPEPAPVYEEVEMWINGVKGHDERDTIVGKFDGVHIDTLFVVTKTPMDDCNCNLSDSTCWEYHETHHRINGPEDVHHFAQCSNRRIPKVELYGGMYSSPSLVFEGDLDGNGTDEWGYLPDYDLGSWRQYRVFTLKNGKWVHLIYEPVLLDTWDNIRGSGLELVEPGPEKGLVKVNYAEGFSSEFKDTLLRPTFTPITKDTP